MNWMSTHPANLATGQPARPVPRGVGVFINPYRISDNYETDPNPDRKAVVVTHAASTTGSDVPHVRPAGCHLYDFFKQVLTIWEFEATPSVGKVRQIIDGIIAGMRS